MLTIGIDPDMHDLALAAWGDNGPLTATVVHVPSTAQNRGTKGVLNMIGKLDEAFEFLGSAMRDTFGEQDLVVAVEGQQWDARAKRGVRPLDIIHLGQVTGAAISAAHRCLRPRDLYFPTPTEWKGQVAKYAHQARLYEELGWGYEIVASGASRYARPKQVPEGFARVSKGQWKHVGDAILLARWAYHVLET